MKVFGFFALLLVVGATVMFFNILIPTSASWRPGILACFLYYYLLQLFISFEKIS